ncbi:MAG: MBOAT family protein [Lachnospira sp.]|nr:MBOAT family protein [Lachnospira sp.]
MSFVSLLFLVVFLPASVLLARLIPERFRNTFLLLVSLLFYAWSAGRNLPVLLGEMVFTYFAARELQRRRAQGDTGTVSFCLLADTVLLAAVLAVYKYSGLPLPAGISFFTFSALSCLFDVGRGKADAEKNPVSLWLYLAFFPKVLMGPIAQYADMLPQMDSHPVSAASLERGTLRFLAGLFKKVLLADAFGDAFRQIHALPQMASMTAVLGTVFYGLQLYYDFSGYSDMAIGAASMFGFHLPRNFDHPYTAGSASDFWRRWHITLGAWFRDYVYIPLGGSRAGKARLVLNLAVVWLLTGIWHGNTVNFVLWGLWWGIIVILEKLVLARFLDKLSGVFRCALVNLAAFSGWIFFFSPTPGDCLHWWGQIFGAAGAGFWNSQTTWYLTGNLILLAAGIAACGTIPARLVQRILKCRGRSGVWILAGLTALLLLLSVARILSSTYQTFLYAAF